jgi:transcriptional regulator with XRE-family HTH domain
MKSQREIGQFIVTKRKAAKLTGTQLAKSVGLMQSALSAIEHGKRPVPADKLAKMAKALDVKPEELVGTTKPLVLNYCPSCGCDLRGI